MLKRTQRKRKISNFRCLQHRNRKNSVNSFFPYNSRQTTTATTTVINNCNSTLLQKQTRGIDLSKKILVQKKSFSIHTYIHQPTNKQTKKQKQKQNNNNNKRKSQDCPRIITDLIFVTTVTSKLKMKPALIFTTLQKSFFAQQHIYLFIYILFPHPRSRAPSPATGVWRMPPLIRRSAPTTLLLPRYKK